LGDASKKPSERCAIARVLARIGGAGATAMLWSEVTSDRPLSLRLAAAEGLRALCLRGALPDVVRLDTTESVEQACGAIELLSRAGQAVAASDAFTASVFRDHARMHVELALTLLSLDVDDRASLSRVQHNLLFEPKAIASAALELFDELLPLRRARRISVAMHAFVEQAEPSAQAALDADVLEGLLGAEPWIRVAAVRHLNAGAAYPTLEAGALSDTDRALYPLLEVVSFLKRVELLRDLPAYYLLEQAEIAAWRTLEAGATLFSEGERGDALYIICSGELEVRVGARVVASLGAGECVGELALLDGAARSATSIARKDAVLLEVPADRWKALLVTQPAAARALLRTLDRRIRATQAGGRDEAPRPSIRRSQFMRAQQLGLAELVQAMSFLKQVALFRDLSSAALANLSGIAQEVRVDTGDTLFEEGDPGESLYLVCSGRLEITVAEQRIAVLERNACVGEMAIISGLPRSATAIALEPSRLLRLGSDDFMSLLGAEPEIALALLSTLAQRLRAASRAPRANVEET
jgi:CRP-like cAMP-binding protein